MDRDDVQRRLLGALLGGACGAAVGSGLSGLWDCIYLAGLPIHHGPAALWGLGLGGVIGLVWGGMAAYPRRWWAGALLSGSAAGVAVFLWRLGGLFGHANFSGSGLAIALAAGALVFLLGLLLGSALRGLLALYRAAFRRWKRGRYVWPGLAVAMAVALGLGLTWPLDYVNESSSGRRTALWKVHRYAEAQGWEGHTLELEALDSAYVVVRVTMPDGKEYLCNATTWQEAVVGDGRLWGVTCQP